MNAGCQVEIYKPIVISKNNYHVLGVMSGTSLDGVDLASCFFEYTETGWNYTFGNTQTIPYSIEWKNRLGEAVTYSKAELKQLDEDYTSLLATIISKFIENNNLQTIDAVCSHGHTILHDPQKGLTFQAGNLVKLSSLVNTDVVCDFRVEDVRLGGQGAPLVPIGDRLLFPEYDFCLNLGGFANISSETKEGRIAYDICPVNIVLNRYAEKLGHAYDADGQIAAANMIDNKLLKELNDLSYYQEPSPKSLGLEWVKTHMIPIFEAEEKTAETVIATVTEHIAQQITAVITPNASVLVTGGGAYNRFLIKRIAKLSGLSLTVPSPEIVEYKEALVFGLLGVLKLRNEINCLASVTGAQKDHSSGKIFRKNMKNEKQKKPDQVVFDEQTQQYGAAIKPYATNVGAPAIQTDDVTSWKNTSVQKANHHFKTRFAKIKKEYESMMEAFSFNDKIYKAKFSFEPVIGQTYYLYEAQDKSTFLSLIAPSECSFKHIGSYMLDTDRIWQPAGETES